MNSDTVTTTETVQYPACVHRPNAQLVNTSPCAYCLADQQNQQEACCKLCYETHKMMSEFKQLLDGFLQSPMARMMPGMTPGKLAVPGMPAFPPANRVHRR